MKLQEYEKLQQKHNKLEHRQEVTKNHLDKANEKIKSMEKIIEDLHNRGFKDYLLRRYPESYQEYSEDGEKS
jgi:dynactin complex subunit